MKPPHLLTVSPSQQADLARLLSGGRMNSYHSAVSAAATTGVAALDVYAFNMALAGSYLGLVHLLEVTSRNAMHARLAALAGRPDWWEGLTLVNRQYDEVDAVVDRLKRDRTRSSYNFDDIVAGLDFGFWTGLLKHGSHALDYEKTLWEPALQYAFPAWRGTRGNLLRKMDGARKFRNRISHHEPIHQLDHAMTYTNLVQLIGYVSGNVAAWTRDRSTVTWVASKSPWSPSPHKYF